MRRAAPRNRQSKWRHVVGLPVAALVMIITMLAAPPLILMMSPQQPGLEHRSAIDLGAWTLSAAVIPGPSPTFSIDVELIPKEQGNTQPPPLPIISAFMRGHAMAERLQTQALGPTRFQAILDSPMPGLWSVVIEADGSSLQIPMTVR